MTSPMEGGAGRACGPTPALYPSSPRRWMLAGVGVVSVGFGAVGAVVPGLPTTIFLIIASACFARSCPWLENRLMRNRLFAPYMSWIDEGRPMPRRAKAMAMGMMWTAIVVSLAILYAGERLPLWLALAIAGAGVAGTVAIATDVSQRLLQRPPPADALTGSRP